MPVTFVLVATIAREADNSPVTVRAPLRVAGNRVLIPIKRVAVPTDELWRSDDRGASWAFSDVGAAISAEANPLVTNQGFWWLYSDIATAFRRTPEGNPGAGGFVSTPMAFTAPHNGYNVANAAVHIMRSATDALLGPVILTGEPPATPTVGNVGAAGSRGIDAIGGNDLLLLQSTPVVRRVTVAPFSVVNSFAPAGTDDGGFQPQMNVAALSASAYWTSTDRDVEPSKSWQSADGGASWTQRNLEAGFWSDVPGAVLQRKGHFGPFARFQGFDFAFNRYLDVGGNPAQSGLHARLARFDAGAGVWRSFSNRVADGNAIVYAGSGVNAAGDRDFYVVTIQTPGGPVRVYRATVLFVPLVPGILGGMSGRSYLGGRRPRRRGVL